jgi:hypothetical protein
MSHTLSLLFKALFLMLSGGKLCVTKQDEACKDTFFQIRLLFQSNLSLKISHPKWKNVTRWGSAKKSVTY